MLKIKGRKKRLGILSLAAVMICASLIYIYYNDPNLGFKYFEPAYLPPGITIKQRRISIVEDGPIRVEQDYRTVDWVYEIDEYKAAKGEGIGTARQNYNNSSVEPTCSLFISANGQKYRLCHWIDYGRISVYQVKFVKDGTLIDSTMPTMLEQRVSLQEVDKFVDSFKSESSIGIPVLRSEF
jgi:hypothetical protein